MKIKLKTELKFECLSRVNEIKEINAKAHIIRWYNH